METDEEMLTRAEMLASVSPSAPTMPSCSCLEKLLSREVLKMREGEQKCLERGGCGQRDGRLWE